jgi:tRNA modification GTPase
MSPGKPKLPDDTIVAVATAVGAGGVGVVRLSGAQARRIAALVTGRRFKARKATLAEFRDTEGELIDSGLVLCFDEGASYTGEETVEFQGHGSPVALQMIVDACLALGARLARPGEFTERSFVNGRMDLAQAEAVADLIASGSAAAVRGAARSLSGVFSDRVRDMAEVLLRLRVYLEADIDFPDEEVDALADGEVERALRDMLLRLETLLSQARDGVRLAQGASVAIVGAPNAGKSSLLNALSGEQTAIVTDIPGTTRDVLKVDLVLDGLPIRLVDTAGLRETSDPVEQEGVRRALAQLEAADLVIYLRDAAAPQEEIPSAWLAGASQVMEVWNKADLLEEPDAGMISVKTGVGLVSLAGRITAALGHKADASAFTARQRHVQSLRTCVGALERALDMAVARQHSELIAEEVRVAHRGLGEIVGEVTSDDLLGEIFSTFCIGK